MTSSVTNRRKIWKGLDHRLFLRIVSDSLSQGTRHVIKHIDKREMWYKENGHQLAGVLLVGYFAYLDGALGSGWVEKYGHKQKKDLYVLRLTRNAITHSNGKLSLLHKPKASKPGKPKDPKGYIIRYTKKLENRQIADDMGNIVPKYIIVENGIVKLMPESFHILKIIFNKIMERAKLIQ
jgi:hypothetical protein